MNNTYIVGTLDVAELSFLLFFVFFIALVVYLNRESRREGYPVEDEQTGRIDTWPLTQGEKKVFNLPHGRGVYVPEDVPRDDINIPAVQSFNAAGAPWVPTGNAMKDGLGPAAYAKRADYPDLTHDGRPRIVPIENSHELSVSPNDPALIGWPVIAADKKVAGKVSDIWVDQSEHIIRYLEVETNAGDKVLAPMFVCAVQKKGFFDDLPEQVEISAITSEQFADVPRLDTPGQVTRYEEDKIMAYYGGGYMYATPERAEPWI
ncbi:MAG: photosynthetic reaction center subunit H [Erythrobacter sp.]|uniref:photosynthetic reaction center subunit H n=1 Tax=Erythrobacter sp. TaxID=1042 RepID=UPI0032EB107F